MNSTDAKLSLFVLCRSKEQVEIWSQRTELYGLSEIVPICPGNRAWEHLREIVAGHDSPVIICQDHVWLGREFPVMVRSLIADLHRIAPDWAACGNRGCLWDLGYSYDYTTFSLNEGSGLESSLSPKVVFTLDDNLLLINCAKLREFELPSFGPVDSRIFGIPLSLECLRLGLPLFADPRLHCVRTECHSPQEIGYFAESSGFFVYYRKNFVNHLFPWPDGDVDLTACVDYDYLASPSAQGPKFDLVELFERSLAKARAVPVLNLCCRTQFRRMELLRRAIASFLVAELEAPDLIKIKVSLVTDCAPAAAEENLQKLRGEFPSLPLECWSHEVRPTRASRTDLMFAAVERADGDYIWFVDDDDYVLPGAARALGRTLVPPEQSIVVGNSLRIEEVWTDGAEPILLKNKLIARHDSRNLLRVLSGANHVPVCGMILPLLAAKAALAGKRALGNFNEDYFVLLSMLLAPQADTRTLDADLAAVSVRGAENTVSRTDTAEWFHSYATFIQELLCGSQRNPILWQLAKRLARVP